ncbi:MAG: hypothetical protein KDB27_23725 [Planctomycetales bacterium]|nr:hypothetical protein [Planctomycetales bacterium]
MYEAEVLPPPRKSRAPIYALTALLTLAGLLFLPFFVYLKCRIEVPSKHMAVLIKKTGKDLTNDMEIAPDESYKGVQLECLGEGRHYRNPWNWRWEVVPQVEIPENKLGVRIRLSGDELPYGHLIAIQETQKGIIPDPLRPGRYAINATVAGSQVRGHNNYVELIELHDPVTIPAGFKGVVTNLSGPMPKDPNVLLVDPGSRGVQAETLTPGRHYVNPYVTRIDLVDCRSKRFDLNTGGSMGFPSKDGFWVTLDGIIEFRVMPDRAAHVFVTYNDSVGDTGVQCSVEEEIINKVILPNARSFCRLRGSDHYGKEFISGETRTQFQEDFQNQLASTCESQGIKIIQALITRIYPPQKIAKPVRDRQMATQQQHQYEKQIVQQESEKQLAIETELIKQKQALVEADRKVVRTVTEAKREQEVALIQAKQKLRVAELNLEAATDLAAAVTAKGEAAAEVIKFKNAAEAAGWKRAVAAFSNDGDAFARWVMLKKIAPSYRQMMVNTADSPIMDIFSQYETSRTAKSETSTTTDAVDGELALPVTRNGDETEAQPR